MRTKRRMFLNGRSSEPAAFGGSLTAVIGSCQVPGAGRSSLTWLAGNTVCAGNTRRGVVGLLGTGKGTRATWKSCLFQPNGWTTTLTVICKGDEPQRQATKGLNKRVLSPAVLPGDFVWNSRNSETINPLMELIWKTKLKLKNVQRDVIKEIAVPVFAPSLVHTSTFV